MFLDPNHEVGAKFAGNSPVLNVDDALCEELRCHRRVLRQFSIGGGAENEVSSAPFSIVCHYYPSSFITAQVFVLASYLKNYPKKTTCTQSIGAK